MPPIQTQQSWTINGKPWIPKGPTIDYWGKPIAQQGPTDADIADYQANDPVEQAKKKTYALTEGRGQATLDDPYIRSALDRLKEIQSGSDVPFTQGVQDQLLSRHGDMSAAAAGSESQQLRDSVAATGGNAADPSFQAAQRAIDARRTAGNNAAAGDIGTQARLANYDAQGRATAAIPGVRMAQVGEANNQFNQAAQYYSRTTQSGGHEPAFNYEPQSLAGGRAPAQSGGGIPMTHIPTSGSSFQYNPGPSSGYLGQPGVNNNGTTTPRTPTTRAPSTSGGYATTPGAVTGQGGMGNGWQPLNNSITPPRRPATSDPNSWLPPINSGYRYQF